MGRKAQSQWDFGELFPAAETRRVLSVSELTTQVKRLLEQQVGQVWVSGEITNLRVQASGHLYFTLKDATAQLSCVLFRGQDKVERELIADGQKVLLEGQLTVYEPRGQYQLRVTAVEAQGVGALQLAFERLKRKLKAEGLFAPERKRPLPKYPVRLGIVTSPTGAALRDVLHVVARRHSALEIVLAPCRVQGQGAAEEIAASIRLLNEWHTAQEPGGGLDLILVTRGGGSLEDLWAFNEEVVARVIHASALPVISAVGHEIDFTMSDFVADVRAATPSAAAEIITQEVFASRLWVAEAAGRLAQLARRRCGREHERLADVLARLRRVHPRTWLNEQWQRLDDLQSSLRRRARMRSRELRSRWDTLHSRWKRMQPRQAVTRQREKLVQLRGRLFERIHNGWRIRSSRFENLQARLRLLSPEQVLARGYSMTMEAETGRMVRDASQVKPGQALRTRVLRGEISSVVK